MIIAENLDLLVGHEVAGGCDQCPAVQRVEREAEGIYRMQIEHENDCPTLRLHAVVLPLRLKVEELRRQWQVWHDRTPEQIVEHDVDFDNMYPEAEGDRLLAATAWRASVLAQLTVLGTEFARRLAEVKGGVGE